MTYEPLHHKYRPQTFADLVGQEAIAQTLTNAIRSQRIAPAYLFTGPRGTGKTSSARILAKSLNCMQTPKPTENPCGICEICRGITTGATLDFVEIDAASNTGVDNIRDLIERTQFSPVQCRYKVYVIDECHMLSTAAFNALLKTLEEPPDRIVFVLATTDPQRVLPTIISRCQRFDFRRIPLKAMADHLQTIAQKEQIEITPEAVMMVAQIAQGGLRDAESLLDQLSLLSGQITVERVWDLVGAVPERDLMKLLEAIADNNPTAILDQARELLNRGREPLVVLQNLAEFYRDLLIAKTAPNRNDLVKITQPTWKSLCEFSHSWEHEIILAGQKYLRDSEVQIKNTTQPRLWLEVTLLGLLPDALRPSTASGGAVNAPPPQTNSKPPSQPVNVPPPQTTTTSKPPSQPVNVPPPPPKSQPEPVSVPNQDDLTDTVPENPINYNLDQLWQQILSAIEKPSTQALMRQHGCLRSWNDNLVCIGIKTAPLLKIAQSAIPSLEVACSKVFQTNIQVRFEVGLGPVSNTVSEEKKPRSEPELEPEPPAEPESLTNVEPGEVSVKSESLNFSENSSEVPLKPNELEEVAMASQKLAQFFQGEVIPFTTQQPTIEPINPVKLEETETLEPDFTEEIDDDDDDPPF